MSSPNQPTMQDFVEAVTRDRDYWRKRSHLMSAAAEETIDRLQSEIEEWRAFGIVDVAARNERVAEYCRHWESRAAVAEKRVAELLLAMSPFVSVWDATVEHVPVEKLRLSDWGALTAVYYGAGGK